MKDWKKRNRVMTILALINSVISVICTIVGGVLNARPKPNTVAIAVLLGVSIASAGGVLLCAMEVD